MNGEFYQDVPVAIVLAHGQQHSRISSCLEDSSSDLDLNRDSAVYINPLSPATRRSNQWYQYPRSYGQCHVKRKTLIWIIAVIGTIIGALFCGYQHHKHISANSHTN